MPASLTVNFIPRWLYNRACFVKTGLQKLKELLPAQLFPARVLNHFFGENT